VRSTKRWVGEREQEALDAVRAFAAQVGHAPTSHEWRKSGGSPSLATLLRMFPTWDAVLTGAGLPPLDSANKYRKLPPERRAAEDEIARQANDLLEAGMSYPQAGAPFGWTHNEVRARVGRYRQARGLPPMPKRSVGNRTLVEIEAVQLADASRDPD
jgi:hypothetical protein